jgi:NADPH-ferrihemoprotein reductase
MGDKFSLITAFSREGAKKVYVQQRLKEHAKEVNELLQQKAYFYVCGDAANMAREVNSTLAKILSEERGIPETKAEEIVKSMRAANQYQVSLIFHLPPMDRAALTAHQEDVWS